MKPVRNVHDSWMIVTVWKMNEYQSAFIGLGSYYGRYYPAEQIKIDFNRGYDYYDNKRL